MHKKPKKRDLIARDLRSPKFQRQVIPSKRHKAKRDSFEAERSVDLYAQWAVEGFTR